MDLVPPAGHAPRSLLVWLLACPSLALATQYVSPSGNDTNAASSRSEPFRTLRRALEEPDSEIVMLAGRYPAEGNTALSISSRSINISADAKPALVDCSGVGGWALDHCDFHLRGVELTGCDGALSIRSGQASLVGCRLSNNTAIRASASAIHAVHASLAVENATITSNGGLDIWRGAVLLEETELVLSDSVLSDNSGVNGSAVALSGESSVTFGAGALLRGDGLFPLWCARTGAVKLLEPGLGALGADPLGQMETLTAACESGCDVRGVGKLGEPAAALCPSPPPPPKPSPPPPPPALKPSPSAAQERRGSAALTAVLGCVAGGLVITLGLVVYRRPPGGGRAQYGALAGSREERQRQLLDAAEG